MGCAATLDRQLQPKRRVVAAQPQDTEAECGAGHHRRPLDLVAPSAGPRHLTGSAPSSPATHPPPDSGAGGGAAVRLVARPHTSEESTEARRLANFFGATPHNAHPIALWLIGPSAVGKSTISDQAAETFGIPRAAGPSGARVPDAVIVDGEFFRAVHRDYQGWIRTPDWRAAYPALKPRIDEEKSAMARDAVDQWKHLVIPHTALEVGDCLRDMREFSGAGYTNHVMGVVAPREAVAARGRQREREAGKRYAADEYDRSLAAFRPMMSSCNGRYEVVFVQPLPQAGGGTRRMAYEVLTSGAGPTDEPNIPLLPDQADPGSQP